MGKKYSKISPTAVFCARMRAKQNLPFAKEICELIDSKYAHLIEDIPDYGETLTSKGDFIPFIEGRYYSLNEALSKIDNAFIVEIASGLSPRSLDFLNRKNIIYLETELSGLIKIKERILKDILIKKNLKGKNLLFNSINPLNKKDIDKIGKIYEKVGKNKRLVIIHEGLLMYFDKKEKNTFMENIKHLFENYAKEGLWLTPDFSRIKKKGDEPKGKENIRDKISKVTKREFDYFESAEETKEFLQHGGFISEILPNKKIVNELIRKKSLQFNKKNILDSSTGYKIWKIQLP
jgi:O-methyltransferase involved in polyketide biosynthesis